MKKFLLLLLLSNALLSQTTCNTSQGDNEDLNVIAIKKCLASKIDNSIVSEKSRGINTRSNHVKRFMIIRKAVEKRDEVKSLSVENGIKELGLVNNKVGNIDEIESSLEISKKTELIQNFNTVDVIPAFRNCKKVKTKEEMKSCFNTQIANFVSENVIYPEEAIDLGINGEIEINFIIDAKGSVSNVTVVGDENLKELKKEVINLLYDLPKFRPATKKNENVPVEFGFSLNFTLD